MFPLPAPGTAEKPLPVAWDPAAPYRGLGWREVEAGDKDMERIEHGVSAA
jgi:hypothetical protein